MSMSMRGDQEPDLEAGFSHEEEEVEEEEAPEFELHALLHPLESTTGEHHWRAPLEREHQWRALDYYITTP